MKLRMPESMAECLYFTNRDNVIAWVYRKECPKCHKAKMGKPVDDKKGSVKTRAKEYVCPKCGYTEDKATHEATINIEAQYTCPSCGKEGESVAPYVRKNFKGVPSYIVECVHCKEKIPITKKLKKLKGKKAKEELDDDSDDL